MKSAKPERHSVENDKGDIASRNKVSNDIATGNYTFNCWCSYHKYDYYNDLSLFCKTTSGSFM